MLKIKNRLYHIYVESRYGFKNIEFLKPINSIIGENYFEIEEGCIFGKMAVLTAWDEWNGQHFSPHISIGRKCYFGDFLHLSSVNKIIIGNNVLTGRWVTITDNSHGSSNLDNLSIPPFKRNLYSKGPIIIEDNVWIGDKVTILPDVQIGKGSVIAANSVVTKDIPSYSVVAGNPAKIIKSYHISL